MYGCFVPISFHTLQLIYLYTNRNVDKYEGNEIRTDITGLIYAETLPVVKHTAGLVGSIRAFTSLL